MVIDCLKRCFLSAFQYKTRHGYPDLMVRQSISGGITFISEYAAIRLLIALAHLPIMWASFWAFLLGLVINFTISRIYVYSFKKKSPGPLQFILYCLMALGSLGLTQLTIWLLVVVWGGPIFPAKVAAAVIVFFWGLWVGRNITFQAAS